MAKSLTFEGQFLSLIFNAVPINNIANNSTSSPLTNLFVALHTADPSAGNQQTSECTYSSYTRVTVARDVTGWTVNSSAVPAFVSPANAITFPAGTGGSGTASFWSVGTTLAAAGEILYSGSISPTIVTGSGVTPILTTASTISET